MIGGSVLRQRGPAIYLSAELISLTGTAMGLVGLAFAVLQMTGSATDVGLVLAVGQLPGTLLLLLGGVAADRLSRRHLVLAMDAVEGVFQAATAAVVFSGSHSIAIVLVLQFVAGGAGGIRYPALTALIGDLVRPDQLQEANGLTALGRNIARLAGGPVAGLVVGFASPAWALLSDAGTFGVSVVLWSVLRAPSRPVVPSKGVLADLRSGFAEVRSRTWLWAIDLQFTVLVGTGWAALQVLGPVVAERSYGGARSYGWMVAAQAVGSIVGGLIAIRWRGRHGFVLAVTGMLSLALPLLALLAVAPLGVVMVGDGLFGLVISFAGVVWYTVMREEIPPEQLGLVIAIDEFGVTACFPLGLAAMGWLAGSIGLHAALGIGVAGAVIPTLGVLCMPDVRRPRGTSSMFPEPAV